MCLNCHKSNLKAKRKNSNTMFNHFAFLKSPTSKTRIENGTTIQTFERRKIVNGTSVFVAVGQLKTISMWVNSFEAVSKQFQNHCETILNCFGKNMISTKKNTKNVFRNRRRILRRMNMYFFSHYELRF